jgi:hypothetical protein
MSTRWPSAAAWPAHHKRFRNQAIAIAKQLNYRIMARATNKIGQSQVSALIANPAGYHHNVVQTLNLNAA